MTEPVWYYARGEVEKGPITTAQIKALAAAGKLRRDDFVWKEGMENWAAAGAVADLFPTEKKLDEVRAKSDTPSQIEVPGERSRHVRKMTSPAVSNRQAMRAGGRGLFVAGLLVTLISRGCDALSDRRISRLEAIPEAARQRFQEDWNRQRRQIKQQQDALGSPTTRDQEQFRQLTEQARQLETKMEQQQKQLEAGLWREYDTAGESADAEHRMVGYWRQVGFLLGTIVLSLGLLGMGFSSDGPERWLSFVMLAIIVYSLFSGQSVWDGVFS